METPNTPSAHLSNRNAPDQPDRVHSALESLADPSIPLSAHVRQAVDLYYAQMKDHDVVDLYAMVIGEVEKPLLEAALHHAGHNQTKAAKALGLSRSTLRKKLEHYGLS